MLACLTFVIGALAGVLSAATFTVSKDGRGAFGSIQAAVDKALPYDEVVILDTAAYDEQVTSRSPSHHVVLRSSNPSSSRKPVIRWHDKTISDRKPARNPWTPEKSHSIGTGP